MPKRRVKREPSEAVKKRMAEYYQKYAEEDLKIANGEIDDDFCVGEMMEKERKREAEMKAKHIESEYYPDLVKMIPLALAESKYSNSKCLIMGRACMDVLDILKEYDKKRKEYSDSLLTDLIKTGDKE